MGRIIGDMACPQCKAMSDYDRIWQLYIAMITGYYSNPLYESMSNDHVFQNSLNDAVLALGKWNEYRSNKDE